MFNIGDTIICVTNWGDALNLVVGKEYTVLEFDDGGSRAPTGHVIVKNKFKHNSWYNNSCFIPKVIEPDWFNITKDVVDEETT